MARKTLTKKKVGTSPKIRRWKTVTKKKIGRSRTTTRGDWKK